ncbi:hypothetical protein TYRP_022806 [Tyrophagus putrescentiae]|nr:hypothetical protein TYRP_022806 [Tyrophagus putrescentiae]
MSVITVVVVMVVFVLMTVVVMTSTSAIRLLVLLLHQLLLVLPSVQTGVIVGSSVVLLMMTPSPSSSPSAVVLVETPSSPVRNRSAKLPLLPLSSPSRPPPPPLHRQNMHSAWMRARRTRALMPTPMMIHFCSSSVKRELKPMLFRALSKPLSTVNCDPMRWSRITELSASVSDCVSSPCCCCCCCSLLPPTEAFFGATVSSKMTSVGWLCSSLFVAVELSLTATTSLTSSRRTRSKSSFSSW